MVSESKLHIIRPRENSPFEIELMAKVFVDGLLVLFMPIVIRTISTGVECGILSKLMCFK